MIKRTAVLLLLTDLSIFLFINFFYDSNLSQSFLFSSALLLINFIILALMWRAVFIHRKAGLVTLVALMKYPIIGISIFWAGRQPWINSTGILIGICSFLIIIVVSVLTRAIAPYSESREIEK